jgi:hypothetical protein
MKNLILLLLSIVCFGVSAQTFVSTTPENKNVVLEEFTGIYCTFCPDGHVIAQDLHDSYPNDIFLINIHTGGYSNPNSPSHPDFNSNHGAAIAANSGLAGYPAGTVNRHVFPNITPQGSPGTTALSRTDWGTASNDIMSQASPVNVAAQASFDMSTGILTVNTETYFTANHTNSAFLQVAVVENNVAGPQTGAQTYNPGNIISGPWTPTYNHQHMLKYLMDGASGIELNVTTAGTFIPNTHTWTVPTTLTLPQGTAGYMPDIDPTNLAVVVFISEGPQEILTGSSANVVPIFPNAYDANLTTSSANDVMCSDQTDISITFRNYGNQALTSLDLTYDINSGTSTTYNWTGNLASGAATTVDIPSVTFIPQAFNDVNWVATNPNGQVDQNTTNNSVSSMFRHWEQQGDVLMGIDAGLINIDITTDSYGSETTWDITAEDGTVIASGGPYGSNVTINETASVGATQCFAFNLYDSYGDGMCCANGVGSVLVQDGSGHIIFEGDPVTLQNFSELSTFFSTGFSTGDAWECTPFGCADVGAGFGSYLTQLDCESDPATGCYIMTSIKEIQSTNILSPTYDVFGREVKKLQKNTMYIRNNKKFIKF